MLKRVLITAIIGILLNTAAGANQLIFSNKVARVGDRIILNKDVERHAALYSLSFEEAKTALIEEELLYIAAQIYMEEPEEEKITAKIKRDRQYLAYRSGKDTLSDDEFTSILLTKGLTLGDYKGYLKRTLWIASYLEAIYKDQPAANYLPTKEEIKKILRERSEIVEEQESVGLSVIYLSFYDGESKLKDEDVRKALKQRAEDCLERLVSGERWNDMFRRYSDSGRSKGIGNDGYLGVLPLDSPEFEKTFSGEIIKALQAAEEGLVKKVFTTDHGYYIFNVISKVPPRKLSGEAARLKAEAYLQSEYKKEQEKKVRSGIIAAIKKEIEVVIY